MKSLTALKVTKEVISYHRGASKVPITDNLLMKHAQARHNYQKRIDEEAKQKRTTEKEKKAEQTAAKKRKADEEDKAKYEDKRRKLEVDEKTLSDEIKFHKVMLREQRDRADKPNVKFEELKAANAAQRHLQELIDKKENSLHEITAKKVKLLDSRIRKKT